MTDGTIANTRMGPLNTSLVVVFTLAIGLMTGPSGEAQNESPEAREIARLTYVSDVFDAAARAGGAVGVRGVRADLERQLRRPLSEDEAGRLQALLTRLLTEMLPKSDFEDFYASLLALHFSPQELVELLAFYRTPLGAKLVRVAPSLNTEASAWGQRMATQRGREFNERFNAEFLREFPSLARERQHPRQPEK